MKESRPEHLLIAAIARSAFAALLAVSFIPSFVQAQAVRADQPSWFPSQPCREAWSGRDLTRYDDALDARFAKGIGNIGYKSYLARLSRAGVERTSCHKKWTVLVYMAADNDLSPYALWDLHEMEGAFASGAFAGSTLRSDLVVQLDTAGRTGVRRLHVFQKPGADYSPPRAKEQFAAASPADIRSPIVSIDSEDQPASAQAHADRLRAFLAWGMRAYPAEHYFVIIWGHGQGWAADPRTDVTAPKPPSRYVTHDDLPITFDSWGKARDERSEPSPFAGRFGGFAFGGSEGDYLGIPTLGSILAELKDTVLEGKRPIDLYAADACLMQMAEVAFEISESVRFIVGSAQVQSYLGLPYRQLMYALNSGAFARTGVEAGTGMDEAYLFARALPQVAARSFDPVRGQQGRSDTKAARRFTMSALSAADLRNQLTPALGELGTRLRSYIAEDRGRALDLQFILGHTPGFMSGAKELGSFAGLLELHLQKEFATRGGWTPEAHKLLAAVGRLRHAIGLTVLAYGIGSDYRGVAEPLHLLGFRSLGIWLPVTPYELQSRITDFSLSSLYRATSGSWEKGLRAMLSQESKSPSH